MKPAPFDYFDPDSLDEALDLLNEYGDDATIIAGGQSLGPILNMRLSAPKVLIDLNRVCFKIAARDHIFTEQAPVFTGHTIAGDE